MTAKGNKLAEAQSMLAALGLPKRQQNETSGYVLLALANVAEDTDWRNAERPMLRVHDMIRFTADAYGKVYAENSRETFRRQVLHQFVQARIVDRNPDDPKRPTNSGKTCYVLTEEALAIVRGFGTKRFQSLLETFQAKHPALSATYRAERKKHAVEVHLPGGVKAYLSAGQHNELQAEVIREFWPRFVPSAKLLYLGDTADKDVYVDAAGLDAAGIPHSTHHKLPDIVFYMPDQNSVVLVEAVTTHGPCSPKRRDEMELLFADGLQRRIYVSAFPSFGVFKKYIGDIAWDTEVWVAEVPDHMIHFNGPKFLAIG